MLAITPQASEAIRGILAAQQGPEESVFRISPQPDAGPVVSIADAAEPDDQIVSGDQVEVCVEPTAAEILDDKQLDATVTDGSVNFSIGEQEG